MRATVPLVLPIDPRYPRPQLVRGGWVDLGGLWEFAADDDDEGLRESWHVQVEPYDRAIVVPFPPESPLSGLADRAAYSVVWYRREIALADLAPVLPQEQERLVLHFGAIDYRAQVWVNGRRVGGHEGGQTPFSLDVTDALALRRGSVVVVVRAEDRSADPDQPRGKQTWLPEARGIYHPRSTGIWQPVWLERRPAQAVERLTWTPDVARGCVRLEAALSSPPRQPLELAVTLSLDGEVLAAQCWLVSDQVASVEVALPRLRDGRQLAGLLWSPEKPTLLDAHVELRADDGSSDRVQSYVGVRSVAVADGAFLLNARAYDVRAVLAQGFWPESHLAAPDADALRREVELVKELGFNAVRVHQKVEDPRFLHWCDRLGLLVWAEMPSAYRFSPLAVQRLTAEWLEVLQRDASSPCIVTWVPLNESWGVPHLADVQAQRHYATALAALTRAVDPSRPVVSNEGWEHADSDIVSVHDYVADPDEVGRRYGDPVSVADVVGRGRPWHRRVCLPGHDDRGQPVMLMEFGGVSCDAGGGPQWGHATVGDAAELGRRLARLFAAVRSSRSLAGHCYTQLTDTAAETNGLLDAARRPKLPMEQLRAIVTGEPIRRETVLPLVAAQRRTAVAVGE